MCIGVWTLEHPDYALIICTNRDEYLDRPTQNAHFHSFESGAHESGNVLSGRDELAGGTWFGLNRAGRVALLTNITEPPKKHDSSRGYLASSFLLSDSSHPLKDEIGKIIPQDAKFAGFNLLLFAPAFTPNEPFTYDALFVTNHGSGGTITSRPLSATEHSCGGISNGIDRLGADHWPKVKHATCDLDAVLHSLTPESTEADLTDRLFKLLARRSPEPIEHRSQCRNTVHVPPLPIIPDGSSSVIPSFYGTRLSTILLIKKNGEVLFIERDIWTLVEGRPTNFDPPRERRFRMNLNSKLNPVL